MDRDEQDRKDGKPKNDSKGKANATQVAVNPKILGQQDGSFQDFGPHVASKATTDRDLESIIRRDVEADRLSHCSNQELAKFHTVGHDLSETSKSQMELDFDGSIVQVDAAILEPKRKRKRIDTTMTTTSSMTSWEEEMYYPTFSKDKHLDESHTSDVLKIDNGRRGKDDKDREQKTKFERSWDDRNTQGKKEALESEFVDDWHEENIHKDIKERDDQISAGRHKASNSKEIRYKDDKALGASHHEDTLEEKHVRSKLKERVKAEEENGKFGRKSAEQTRDYALGPLKSHASSDGFGTGTTNLDKYHTRLKEK